MEQPTQAIDDVFVGQFLRVAVSKSLNFVPNEYAPLRTRIVTVIQNMKLYKESNRHNNKLNTRM